MPANLDDLFDDLSAPAVPPTPPVTDTVGKPFYLGTTDNTYGTDNPYVLALAIGETPCFGTYTVGNAVCDSCPLGGACRARVYSLLGEFAAHLDEREARALRIAEGGTPVTSSNNDIDEIVASLGAVDPTTWAPSTNVPGPINVPSTPRTAATNTAARPAARPAAPPVASGENGIEITASGPGKCDKCKGPIAKKDTVMFIPGKGMRHKVCP